MPNLAVLGVDPECSPAEAGKGIMMQQMRYKWSAFESDAKAELTTLQQAFNLFVAGNFEQLAQVIQSSNLKQQAHENSADLVALLSETLSQIVDRWLDKKQASTMSADVISSPSLGIDIDANSLSQHNPEWPNLGFEIEDVNWDGFLH
ncbi:hypothetical protein NPX13_g10828 [Xylaria arbuscula]|uniref:Uncharacterized protein n=1 Tax=Xylaria arbuscula TaxID=114810 RepID=A0A9W8N3Z0_9PEZI|nr:hypothetical protein NPX13_g10828 [Xylaria arbuscula]